MTTPQDPARWFTSSRSKDYADCVEVALGQNVGVRDTKDRVGGQLVVPTSTWSAFTEAVKTDR